MQIICHGCVGIDGSTSPLNDNESDGKGVEKESPANTQRLCLFLLKKEKNSPSIYA